MLKPIPILALAARPIMDPDTWSPADQAHAVAWARGEMPIPPAPLSAWVAAAAKAARAAP